MKTMSKIRSIVSGSIFAAMLALTACGGGTATNSTCPTPAITYAGFGQTFFANYCTRCHSEYKTEEGIKAHLDDIDAEAASGPGGTNTSMPESGAKPSDAERMMLGQFLACEKL